MNVGSLQFIKFLRVFVRCEFRSYVINKKREYEKRDFAMRETQFTCTFDLAAHNDNIGSYQKKKQKHLRKLKNKIGAQGAKKSDREREILTMIEIP